MPAHLQALADNLQRSAALVRESLAAEGSDADRKAHYEARMITGVLGGHHGGEHHGLAVGGEHGAIGLTGDLAGFKPEGTATPVDFDGMNLEHVGLFHGFTKQRRPQNTKTMRKIARR